MSEWISVKDGLPEVESGFDCSKNVFTTDGKKIFVMTLFYDADGWMWANCYGDINSDGECDDDYNPYITHWMPLPNLPKE